MKSHSQDPFKDPHIHLRPDAGALEDGDSDAAPARRRWTPLELEALGIEDYPRIPNAPARGRSINWGKAAEVLAKGHTVETAAYLCGCDAARIWRNLRRSRKFRARIDLAAERLRLLVELRFRTLNDNAVRQMQQQAGKLDVKTLHWLAEKLRLGQGPELAPEQAGSIADWIASVAAVPGHRHGRRRRVPDAACDEPDPTGPNGIELASNGIELASNGIEPASNRIEPAGNRLSSGGAA